MVAKSTPASTPRYAAILVDARTHEILYSTAADEPRHPASITKVMTLFLAFDALANGRLKLNDPVVISTHAASQKPSRLGLGVGKSLTVDQAIRVIAVKSANDVAVALAEKIAGSEDAFVTMMNRRAQSLGMRNTNYANASGLPNPINVTTARDIALLSVALLQQHSDNYAYFSLQGFNFGKQAFTNHNRLLGKVIGVDGIKTGYTVDAGYTLAASAVRDGRRLIAVVLGEPSIAIRNRDVTQLLETGFTVLQNKSLDRRLEVAELLPREMHPAFRYGPIVEQGSREEANGAARAGIVQAVPVKNEVSAMKADARATAKAKTTARKSSAKVAIAKAATRKKTAAKSKSANDKTKVAVKSKTGAAKSKVAAKSKPAGSKTKSASKSDAKAPATKIKTETASKSKSGKSKTADAKTKGKVDKT